MTALLPFDNAYVHLPEQLFARVQPTPVADPQLMRLNEGLARQLGLDPEALKTPEAIAVFAGNDVPEGADPLAMAYAGHQFGNFVPKLGDGRAILLGEVRDTDGVRWDVQLKGAGPTPFSRGGDGRNWVGPVLREYVVSEAMHTLGVPTTRALAAVTTGQPVYRERPQPGAVLVRLARSHVRVGTFEFFAVRNDLDALEALVGFVRPGGTAWDVFEHAVHRQASLVAHWLSIGFIHGVMNTDNCSVVGDTIDYGPCAFLDDYHPNKVFSSIDHMGRYAYSNQPRIAQWNLAVLAHSLMPLMEVEVEALQDLLKDFVSRFDSEHRARMRAKVGIVEARDSDDALVADLLTLMADQQADFTRTFRALSHLGDEVGEGDAAFHAEFRDPGAALGWLMRWRQRVSSIAGRQAQMQSVNPAYIPRNHRIEQAIQAGVDGDFGPMHTLCEVLAQPFVERDEYAEYALAPESHEVVRRTFCGT